MGETKQHLTSFSSCKRISRSSNSLKNRNPSFIFPLKIGFCFSRPIFMLVEIHLGYERGDFIGVFASRQNAGHNGTGIRLGVVQCHSKTDNVS